MKNLSRDEMKKVIGGLAPGGVCGSNTEAHCTWGGGACTGQAWGACPSGSGSSCGTYCVKSDNTTYWP